MLVKINVFFIVSLFAWPTKISSMKNILVGSNLVYFLIQELKFSLVKGVSHHRIFKKKTKTIRFLKKKLKPPD
jgi:hypothetical protein